MAIDASINYHITNSRVATYGIYNISDAIALFTKATLRNSRIILIKANFSLWTNAFIRIT